MLLLPEIETEFIILQPVTFLTLGDLPHIYVAQERDQTFHIRREGRSYIGVYFVSYRMCNGGLHFLESERRRHTSAFTREDNKSTAIPLIGR
jgi:hypothetical protein